MIYSGFWVLGSGNSVKELTKENELSNGFEYIFMFWYLNFANDMIVIVVCRRNLSNLSTFVMSWLFVYPRRYFYVYHHQSMYNVQFIHSGPFCDVFKKVQFLTFVLTFTSICSNGFCFNLSHNLNLISFQGLLLSSWVLLHTMLPLFYIIKVTTPPFPVAFSLVYYVPILRP